MPSLNTRAQDAAPETKRSLVQSPAGAILVLGRDLVMVPKLIHPLPPSTPRSSGPVKYDDLDDQEPPTPHPTTDTWMAVCSPAPQTIASHARLWVKPPILDAAGHVLGRTFERQPNKETMRTYIRGPPEL